MTSRTRWTRTLSEWTPGVGDGQGGLAYCNSWGRKESDTTERLNWTELNRTIFPDVRTPCFWVPCYWTLPIHRHSMFGLPCHLGIAQIVVRHNLLEWVSCRQVCLTLSSCSNYLPQTLFRIVAPPSGSSVRVLFVKREGNNFSFVFLMQPRKVKSLSRVRLCYPMDCRLPGSSVHVIFQARVLEWVAISFSRGSSRLRDWTPVSLIAGGRFTL